MKEGIKRSQYVLRRGHAVPCSPYIVIKTEHIVGKLARGRRAQFVVSWVLRGET